MHTDIGYNKKICCSFPVFVILGADSQIPARFCKISAKLSHTWTRIELICLQTVINIVLEVYKQGVQPQYCDVFKL